MPLAASEANKLTTPNLLAGIIETVIERGASDFFAQAPFRSWEGQTLDFTVENQLATGDSAQDPYGTTINSGGGSNTNYSVDAKMYARNADTAVIDLIGKSDINSARTNDIMKEAKKLGQDLFRDAIYGRDDGDHTSFNNIFGFAEWRAQYSSYTEQDVYNTDDGNVDGTQQDLSLNAIDDLLSRQKGDPFDVIYTDRATHVYLKSLLNAAGGNRATHLMEDTFGRQVLTYDGTPVLKHDGVGTDQLSWSSADAFGGGVSTASEIVVTDSDFTGFAPFHEHHTLTHNSNNYTIDSVDASDTVTVTSAGSSNTGNSGSLDSQNLMIAVRYDELDGVTFGYHESMGGIQPETGEHYGPIAGFTFSDFNDKLEDSERIRGRLSWYGNLLALSPYSIATLSKFTLG